MSPLDTIYHDQTPLEQGPNDRVLLVGERAHALSNAYRNVVTLHSFEASFGMVAVLDRSGLPGLFETLAQHGKLTVPIADFTGGLCARSDFVSSKFTEQTLAEALHATCDMRNALSEMASIAKNDDYFGLTALALAKSRNTSISAHLNPSFQTMVDYPLLLGVPDPGATLEALAAAKILERSFFERTQCCSHCDSARVVAREVCSDCGSANISEENLVHHYKCGHQGEKSSFRNDGALICPKCDTDLKHFGVDYDTPGQVFVCNSCGAKAPEPEVSFACGDCHGHTRGEDMHTKDWFSYDLTMAAEAALLEGRLPSISFDSLTGNMLGRRTPRDLAMLINMSHRVYNRYKRDYSVLLINTMVADEELETARPGAKAKVQKLVVDLLGETVRETDSLAVISDTMVVLLPETPKENSSVLGQRLNTKIDEVLGAHAQAGAQMVGDEEIEALIDMLSKG